MVKDNSEILPLLSWFRDHFTKQILPNWLIAAVDPNGFFYPNLNRVWSRSGEPIGTLVSQSRLLYVFSNGFLVTGDPHLQEVIRSGGSFLIDHFADPTEGGFAWACDSSGFKTDFTKDAYGHAFALLGFVKAYEALRQEIFLEKALGIADLLDTRFSDKQGGITWKMSRDWKDKDKNRSQNPIMHAFEALLELLSVVNQENQRKRIENKLSHLVDFLFSRIPSGDPVILPEIYTRSWEPINSSNGGYVSAGHLFEWSFLLSKDVGKGLPDTYLNLAGKLLDTGLSLGYQKEKGYIKTWIDETGKIIRDDISWWEQSEGLRTLLHFILTFGRTDLKEYFDTIFHFVRDHFLDPVHGGWFTSLDPWGVPRDTNKGSAWKLDYHQTALCMEAIHHLTS